MKRPLPQRLLIVAVFLALGAGALLTIAHIADPPGRCEARGGTWMVDGRYCEEAAAPDQRSNYLANF
tara:strand:- start:896 stop:1096 length:201 start_codon:yes stop_codon:yes gene_type:complete